MLMRTLFVGGGGSEKVYVLYIHLNVDNYRWPLRKCLSECSAAPVAGYIHMSTQRATQPGTTLSGKSIFRLHMMLKTRQTFIIHLIT